MAIRVLGSLCLGVAHQPNKAIQKEIASTDALHLLVNFMLRSRNFLIKVSCLASFFLLNLIRMLGPLVSCWESHISDTRHFYEVTVQKDLYKQKI